VSVVLIVTLLSEVTEPPTLEPRKWRASAAPSAESMSRTTIPSGIRNRFLLAQPGSLAKRTSIASA